MNRGRTGTTLIEVAIALAIFSTVLVITIESLSGIRRFVNTATMEDGLADEADRILTAIADDLANSAWLIQVDESDLDDLSTNATYDRMTAQYYPYVVVQDYETATASDPTPLTGVNGMPNSDASHWYAEFKRGSDEIVTPEALDQAKPNLPRDHRLPSQELIFLKVARGTQSDDPALVGVDWIDFNADPAPMTRYNDLDELPVIDSMGLATRTESGTSVVADVPLAWEASSTRLDAGDVWDSTDNEFNMEYLRNYTYALVPGGAYGTRLVRRYRNEEGGGVEELDELSTSVDRITIDTYRTAGDLAVNQIRIRLWLSRPSEDNPLVPVTYFAESVLAMRSTVDPEYSLKYTDWLGQAGAFGF